MPGTPNAPKLDNASFVDKAPAEVVQKERDKLAEMDSALTRLRTQHEEIATL